MWTRNKVCLLSVMLAAGVLAAANAQEKPGGDGMQSFREQLKAGKKQVVADYMKLSEAEARAFWPVYDAYDKELDKLNARLYKVIETYAGYYNTNTLTDENAQAMTDEALAIEAAEVELKRGYVTKVRAVLPGIKVARFLQIENKVRAVVRFEIAAYVPVAP